MKLVAVGIINAVFLASCGMSQKDHAERIGDLKAQLEREVPVGSSEVAVRDWLQAHNFTIGPWAKEEGNLAAVGKCFRADEWYCGSWCAEVEFDLNAQLGVQGYRIVHVGDCI